MEPFVRLDQYHLLERLFKTLASTSTGGKNDPVGNAAVRLAISSAFTSEQRGLFPAPNIIMERMEQVKDKFLPKGTWTEATTAAWSTQQKHVQHCLTLPAGTDVPIVIHDRNGKEYLVRSTGNNENLHMHLPEILPSSGGLTLIDTITSIHFLERTMKKIVKFNASWPNIT